MRPNYTPETIDTAWLAIREWLAPRLLGHADRPRRAVHASLARDIRGHNMAKAALEMGCWGLAAEARARPLSRMLGGTRERVPTGISLGIQPSPEVLVERAPAARRRRVPQDQAQDPAGTRRRVRRARCAPRSAPDVELMADANAAYTLDDAAHLAALNALDAFACSCSSSRSAPTTLSAAMPSSSGG